MLRNSHFCLLSYIYFWSSLIFPTPALRVYRSRSCEGWNAGRQMEAEHVAMALPDGEHAAMGGRSQQPANGRTEAWGEAGDEAFGFFFFWEEEEGYFNFTIHTQRSRKKTSQACMHACIQAHTRAAIQTHTFYWRELNLCASRHTALELFMAARLQARP